MYGKKVISIEPVSNNLPQEELEKIERARQRLINSQRRKALHRKKRQLYKDIDRLTAERYIINEEMKARRIRHYQNYTDRIREKRNTLGKILMELNPVGQ